MIYRIADNSVSDFFVSLRRLAENHLAEVEQVVRRFFEGKIDEMEHIDRETLLRRVKAGEAILLDVRPHEEYEAGHISGAISIPLKALKERLSELSKDKEIVAYCRGPYCIMSRNAVEILKQSGLTATYITDGVPEWRASGMPTDKGVDRYD